MIKFVIYNDYTYIQCEDSELLFHADEILKQELAYFVPNSEWSPKFKEEKWDGYIRLYYKSKHRFPTGLAKRAKLALDKLNTQIKFIDKRILSEKDHNISLELNGINFRDYQELSIKRSIATTRGICGICTGGGKTIYSCGVIAAIKKLPVLFIVPSVYLLKQTAREFEKIIRIDGKPIQVGRIGGGDCQIIDDGINICTYQTALQALNTIYNPKTKKMKADPNAYERNKKSLEQLYVELKILEEKSQILKDKDILNKIKKIKLSINQKEKIKEKKLRVKSIINNCQVLFIDEAHLAAEIIETISLAAQNAYYKYGLSATPYRLDNQEIRMEGALGRSIINISPSDLIKKKHLVKPHILTIPINSEYEAKTFEENYFLNIVNNWERNYRIKQIAEYFHNLNLPVLILVERLHHGQFLEKLVNKSVFVPGGEEPEEPLDDAEFNYRERMLQSLEKNEIILIATQWANTGVDAPKTSVVILAGSSSSPITTYQQIGRGLRLAKGKTTCFIIDFKSKNKTFKSHLNERKKVYNAEDEFLLYELKGNNLK